MGESRARETMRGDLGPRASVLWRAWPGGGRCAQRTCAVPPFSVLGGSYIWSIQSGAERIAKNMRENKMDDIRLRIGIPIPGSEKRGIRIAIPIA